MQQTSRRSTSLSLNQGLLDEARELGVNISRAAERGVSDAVRVARNARWKEENAAAIHAYNRFIDENGVPLRELRKF